MCFKFDVHTTFCARCRAPSLSSETVKYVASKTGKIIFQTYPISITSLTESPSTTYSASVG